MARKRMISPDFFSDEKVGALSPIGRLIFIGLWILAEDNGVGRANMAMLRGQILPYDDISLAEFTTEFQELSKLNLINTYEVKGQSYYRIINFLKHQTINHPTPCKLPTETEKSEVLPEDYRNTTVVLPEDSPTREYNIKEKNTIQSNTREYGSGHNVPMTEEQRHQLSLALGEERSAALIEDMSLYLRSSGKRYNDYYSTLLKWARREDDKSPRASPTPTVTEFERQAFAELHKEDRSIDS